MSPAVPGRHPAPARVADLAEDGGRPLDLDRDVDLIVVGASAGGFEALLRIVQALPSGFVPAMLVVLHLPPESPSPVAGVLDRACRLPVREALDKAPVEPGSVTIAPPDYHLLVEASGRLALSVDEPVLYSRPAIDPLFESASVAYAPRLLGIVLTGASRDGSAGLAALRQRGGHAWVQSADDAHVPTMPAAALEHAGADAVLTLTQICRRLGGMPR